MKCKDCHFWDKIRSGGNMAEVGRCIRFPPTRRIITDGGQDTSNSTGTDQVYEFDWCGEFEPKKQEANK